MSGLSVLVVPSPVDGARRSQYINSSRDDVQVLLKALLFLPEASIPCLDALQALLMVHAPQRADFIRSQGAAKLCTVLGESAFSEDALLRGMELLCTLAWQLRRNGEGAFRLYCTPSAQWALPVPTTRLTPTTPYSHLRPRIRRVAALHVDKRVHLAKKRLHRMCKTLKHKQDVDFVKRACAVAPCVAVHVSYTRHTERTVCR